MKHNEAAILEAIDSGSTTYRVESNRISKQVRPTRGMMFVEEAERATLILLSGNEWIDLDDKTKQIVITDAGRAALKSTEATND